VNTGLLLLIITITTALIFDFLNGFHDAANSIATVVSTRVLSPKLAVVWAAFFNFVAAFVLGTAVAHTIGKGMIRLDDVTQYVVIAGLAGAIVWDLLTAVLRATPGDDGTRTALTEDDRWLAIAYPCPPEHPSAVLSLPEGHLACENWRIEVTRA